MRLWFGKEPDWSAMSEDRPIDPILRPMLQHLRRAASSRMGTQEVLEAVNRLALVAGDRLLAALAMAGELEVDPSEVRVADLLRTLAADLSRREDRPGPDLEWSAPPLVELRTDAALISRVLGALLRLASRNAPVGSPLKLLFSTPANRPTFRLEARPWSTESPLQAEEGGMDLEDLHFLVAAGLGGELREEPARGSFLLQLPVETLASAPFPLEAMAEGVEEQGSPSPDRATVLVVDDSRSTRNMLEHILGQEHRVLTAESGPEAIAVALDQLPDLVLLDLLMEGMDGFAVCARLKSDPRTEEIPVIFLTSVSSESDEVLALEAGAIDFITKPVGPTAVAARVRNHLELKRTHDRLREVSLLDGLTGIANRRRFDRHLQNEWMRNLRRQTPLALIMGDVDHFKAYNDGYGHTQGDDCLRQIATAFRQAARRNGDLSARYGGEEFCVILPETDLAGAMAVAERIRALVRAMALPHAHAPERGIVSLSLGVAVTVPSRASRPSQLVEEADARLYEAKRHGRDRVSG